MKLTALLGMEMAHHKSVVVFSDVFSSSLGSASQK
ncbi:hypothetical protein SC383S_09830 [Aggregatibacter actinomycetemcomitans SC383s]|nr:hypothetical protein SC383S_09830 [Aggregatibacter actinomycetemcomitans SC383s]